jgi:hypothetical protein
MDDSEYLSLRHHEPATCGTCRTRRGEAMVCAICQTPFTPEEPTMLCYTSRETPPHFGTIHTSCSEAVDDAAIDDTFIRY